MANIDPKNISYYETPILSKQNIDLALQSTNNRRIADAILSACKFIYDYDYVISICKKFGFNKNDDIKLSVLSALSIIVCDYEKIDIDLAYKIINFFIENSDENIKVFAIDIKEDLEHFVQLYNLSF